MSYNYSTRTRYNPVTNIILKSFRKMIRKSTKLLKPGDTPYSISIPFEGGHIELTENEVGKLLQSIKIKYNGSIKTDGGPTLMIKQYAKKKQRRTRDPRCISLLSVKNKEKKNQVIGVLGYNIPAIPSWITHDNQYIRLSKKGKMLIVKLSDDTPLNSLDAAAGISSLIVNAPAETTLASDAPGDSSLVVYTPPETQSTSHTESQRTLIVKSQLNTPESGSGSLVPKKPNNKLLTNVVPRQIESSGDICDSWTFDIRFASIVFCLSLVYFFITLIYSSMRE